MSNSITTSNTPVVYNISASTVNQIIVVSASNNVVSVTGAAANIVNVSQVIQTVVVS